MKLFNEFKKGFVKENPTFRLALGMCPTLAVTTSAINGLGMGLATTFVLLGSNLVISLIRNIVPDKIRIPIFITVIAGFVTVVEMLMKAYLPSLDQALGIFIPLIVVNCIILARAEMYACKNKPLPSIIDALGMGLGFTASLFVVGIIREVLGAGEIFGLSLVGESISPIAIMILPPGGFLVLGLLMALFNKITNKPVKENSCMACPMKCGEDECGEEVVS